MPNRLDKQRSKWFERDTTWRRNVSPARTDEPQLGKPVRSFASTFSAVTVLKEMFFPKSKS